MGTKKWVYLGEAYCCICSRTMEGSMLSPVWSRVKEDGSINVDKALCSKHKKGSEQ